MPFGRLEISRRSLLASGLGVGAAVALSACSAAVDQDKVDTSATTAGTPKSGGTLAVAIPDDLVPANLFTNSNTAITSLIGLIFEGLTRYPDNKLTPEPRLATSWNLASDGLSLTLNLRQGVKFHTGREFTSKDVEFSLLKVWADPANRAQELSSFQAVKSVDTTDPYTAVLHLAHPLGNLFDILDTAYIVDSETWPNFLTGKQLVGTGPFVYKSWTPNTDIIFEKNPDYWQPGRPYLDGVHISITPDPDALLAAIKSGQADLVLDLDFLDASILAKNPDYTVLELVGAEDQIYVGTNLEVKPLDDIRVRQAIAYAIDRERIVNEVFYGSAYAVNLPWPTYSTGYDAAKNATYTYDPDRAKALVAQVGDIPSIQYTYPTSPAIFAATAQIVQSNLAAVGITVELNPIDTTTFTTELIGATLPGIWTTYHSWAQYQPSTLTVSAYPFNAAHNASHYTNATYSADADAAWTVPDGSSAAAIADYAKVSNDLLSALFLIEIAIVKLQFVYTARLHGVSYTKRSELNVTDAYLASQE